MNPEDLLTDALADRVERTDYPATPLSTVAGRAGALRARRLRRTSLAAAAAVAAVVVPGAVWLGHSPGSSPQPGQTLSSGPTTTPTTQPTARSSDPLVLDALPLGHKPGIDYLQGDTYITMNGDRITSPVFRHATTATPVGGGILASVPPAPGLLAQGGIADISLVSDGRHQALGCGSDRFAMSTDGVESAYWLADSCPFASNVAGALYSGVNNTMGESGPGRTATPVASRVEPIGIVQQGTVADVVDGHTTTAQVIGQAGQLSRLASLASAGGSDENHDVVSGQLASDPDIGAIVDAASGAVRVRVPGWDLGQFSNDGKYVLGDQPRNGPVPDERAIFDARTGAKLVELPGLGFGASIGQIAWDFDDTVLATAESSGLSTIVRFDLDGHVTRATRVVDAVDGFRLATRS